MRNVESHNNILQDKIDEAVTHYINVQQHESEQLPMDTNDLEYTTIAVQGDGGGRVTVMHQQAYPTMCRQVSEQGVEGQWNELELDEGRIAAIVAHLAQNQRTAHHHPQAHPKITSVRNVVDTSVILDGSRFNGQVLDNQTDSIVVDLPPLQSLPPLPNMKRCPETDWFHDKDKKNDASILTDSDSPVLDLNPGASPVQNKQSKKSLPHKKRISKKLKRNNGSCTPQQEVVVINGVHSEQEHEQILPDNYVTVQQSTHHIQHELRPVLICQICGVFYGEEQLKFFHHLKQHYEPHGAIIIENPVSDLVIDKMSNTCIVDNGSTLPDSIVELSLENTVPKTMYQSIDKHILYTTHDKTLNYNSNKVQYTIASVDKDVVQETEKTDLYETLDKLEFNNCGKCHKPVRKKHCEIHKREQAVNPKLEELSEFSEPEDLMAGIQVVVGEYEPPLLPLDHEHEHDHRHWTYGRSTSNGAYCPRTNDTQPLKVLKEEVLQRIFEGEVASGSSFTETIIPGAEHETEDHRDAHETHEAHEQDMPEQDMPEQDMPEQDMPEQDMPERDEHNEQEHCQEHSMDKCEQYMEGKDMAYDDKSEDNDMKKNGRCRSKDKSTLSCGVCGRVFVHRNSLVYHALTHANKQHACYCGAGFYTRAALNIHKRVHSGDKPYKCDECGRQFRQMGDLRYHKSSLHSDKKEFKCEFCGKEFARKYSLNVHRRIHTGEKNYPCHYCNKTFRASSYRLAHMKTHTGDRPHKCEVCDKNFRSSHDLRRHMQIHDKLQNKMDNAKIKIKDKKSKIDSKEKIILNESPSKVVKKIAVASTTARIPLIRKGKRKSDSKKAPNVTVQSKDCYEDVFELRNMELAKFKDVYSEVEKDDNLVPYKSQVYKESEEKDMATLRRMLKTQMDGTEKVYNRENTDGKMQVYTHVEKSNGSVNSNGLNEDTERHVEGEVIDNVFIAGLTALYNVPT